MVVGRELEEQAMTLRDVAGEVGECLRRGLDEGDAEDEDGSNT